MENYKKVTLSALLGIVSFASLAASDNYSQGYSQQDGNFQGQGGYYQGGNQGNQAQGGYYQGGNQGNQAQGGYYQDANQHQGYQSQGGYQGQQRGYDSQGYGSQTQSYGSQNDNSNEAIGLRVLKALQQDNSLSTPRKIQVTAHEGNIILTGSVKSDDEKNKVESIAKQVNGVKSVSNQLTITK